MPSIKSGYSLSDEAIAALQSGDIQRLIDSRNTGLIMMADDGDDDDDDDDDDGDSGDSGSGDGDDKGGKNDDDDDAGSDGDDDDDEKVTKADLKRALARMKAADKRASEAEARLRKIDDDKKDDLTKATDRVTELEGDVEEKDKTIGSLRLQIAFLSSNKITWHKPGAALKLAQSEGYLDDLDTDTDGNITPKAMEQALAKLAKDNDYLVKPREGAGPSGSSAGGRSGNGKDDKQTEDEDRRRAPALARRR
jgi:hypothetical protein